MTSEQIIILIIFIVYLVAMIGIGVLFSRRKMNNAQYVLGGRQLNPWVTAMSAQASDMSGWLLQGLPGKACTIAIISGGIGFATGSCKSAIFIAIGLLLGTILNWVLTARRLRVYTEVSNNSLTVSGYLGNRFKDDKNIIKIIAAVVMCIFFTFYAASMFVASAKLFNAVFGLEYNLGLIIGVVVIAIYVILGGFLAVSWTDLIQGVLMFFALIIIPIICMARLSADAVKYQQALDILKSTFSFGLEEGFGGMEIINGLAWGLGYFGMPHILVRFMGIKSDKQIKPAATIAIIWVIITLFAAVVAGIIGAVLLGQIGTGANEKILIEVIQNLFNNKAIVISGILLSAVLAAIMSTADSQLLVASTSFSNDIYGTLKKAILKKETSDKEYVWVGRILVLVLSIIGFVIALDQNSTVFALVDFAWGGLGASFGPVILFSLYSKKVNKWGAISSIASGAIVAIIWNILSGGIFDLYEIVPGFIVATIVLFVVSILTEKFIKKEDRELMDKEFDEMVKIIKTK
ncbi:MAG: sodium/proline symporter PutP [Clostridiales bacterium]|nr:sodium/proline symporter PutP [Clostridiales bacterium]